MTKKVLVLVYIISVCFSLILCNSEKDNKDTELLSLATLYSIGNQGIQFSAYAGSQKLECGQTLRGHSRSLETISFIPNAHIAESTTFQLRDFRLFVHGVTLIQNSGEETPLTLNQDGKFQLDDLALLDFENKTGKCNGTTETNNVVSAFVTPGTYKGIKFILGVPENKNHLDANNQPSPLNSTGMFWSWTSGFKFLKLDFETAETGSTGSAVHIGSANCTGSGSSSTCARINRIPVTLTPEGGFNPATQEIKIDIQALLNGTDLTANQYASLCMSGLTGITSTGCPIIFPNIGLDLNAGTPTTPTKTVFSIKAKN
ncbi:MULTISPECIES: MbnP family copper-binding protein [Leptospira]|uniref:AZL_007920/MXAN_0976 family protein n=2 Tax=Leptospira interrogans TaxID=173 RepID=M6K2C8_LEPIR|nr:MULTISPECIES: MbnP family copper-binding protein [Leptospira]EMN28264.1 AZL_007920/MXAN_0976 family protein [Leptospira interrogans serovar Pyrogenes str. L0374]EKO05813.1 AZL_007920/MXAN_0976 family protein [Leptospira interrogans str. C10069]EMN61760.1 AZL_007920/MXAN_0976 family protein [Leptospira interrogans serovar Pyrogenes str. R168]QCO32513.1 metallo-mystery pair system four-Cys motif protein [Leptospira interrogans]ULG84684.1 metallo-mystery pair system four-Cys motif protein [Lep